MRPYDLDSRAKRQGVGPGGRTPSHLMSGVVKLLLSYDMFIDPAVSRMLAVRSTAEPRHYFTSMHIPCTQRHEMFFRANCLPCYILPALTGVRGLGVSGCFNCS